MEAEEPKFSDWEVKRIRYRLLVYLRHLQFAYDNRDKTLPPAQTTKQGEAGRNAATRPSLEVVARQIQNCYEAEDWVNLEIHPKGKYKEIEERRGYKENEVFKTTAITYQKLFLFVIGEVDKKSHNFPRQKFNKPNARSLKGIYEFLKAKRFISDTDMDEPAPTLSREEAIEFFSSLGLKPQEIHENEYFNGDYIAIKTAYEDGIEFTTFQIHTEKERVYNRSAREYEPPELYKARIQIAYYKNGKDLRPIQKFTYEGLGVFKSDQFAVFYYQRFSDVRIEYHVGNIGSVQLGDTIIADDKVDKTRKVVAIPNQAILFSHSLSKLHSPSNEDSLQMHQDKSEVLNSWDSIRIYDSKHVFEKTLQNKLLFSNIGGIMSEDNNNDKGADKKRKNLSGKFLFRDTTKEAEELSKRLSDIDMDEDNLIALPQKTPIASITQSHLSVWEDYKNEGFNARLYFAAATQDLPIADEAIRHGADINYIHPRGNYPIIIIAARASAYLVIERLLACDELNLLVKGDNGRSVSEILSYGGAHPEFVDMLIEAEMKQVQAVGNTIKGLAPFAPPEPYEP